MAHRDFLLVGHRGTGKTTLARALRERGFVVVDLDRELERATGQTCAQIIAAGEDTFRRLEREHLAAILASESEVPRIIVPGAGCLSFPAQAIVVWLRRDGWVRAARDERERLRPEWTFEAEIEWMISTREQVWRDHADLVYDIPTGRSLERTTDDLETWLRWVDQTPGEVARKTWVVATPERLAHCAYLQRRLGLAGVEIRSDLFESWPDNLDVPSMASLRTDDASWLRNAVDACAVDVDLTLASTTFDAAFRAADERHFIVSAHPGRRDLEASLAALRARISDLPDSVRRSTTLKFAPQVERPSDVAELLRVRESLGGHTLLVQGTRWSWLRPLLAADTNSANYLAPGIAGHRRGEPDAVPPLDLMDWLPHLGLSSPGRFRALVGQPVAQSQGDLWHRRAALRSNRPEESYLKAECPRGELVEMLAIFEALGINGVSVTSPLKPEAAECVGASAPLNTLRLREAWEGTDTDEIGMRAALQQIERAGIGPGTCAVIGRGGVSRAVLQAIEASEWTLAYHRGAREGWGEARAVTLVVNGAGTFGSTLPNAPECEAWLDLHYSGTVPPPVEAKHFTGDAFFDAQARAQREFWDQ